MTDELIVGDLGYQGKDIPEKYLITITNVRPVLLEETGVVTNDKKTVDMKTIIIKAPLQEGVEMSTASKWSPLVAASIISGTFAGVLQGILGRTTVNRWTSRRIWHGTSPIELTLNLKFEAIEDSNKEVMMPCRELQRLNLPWAQGDWIDKYLLLAPGPNPYRIGWSGIVARILPGVSRAEETTAIDVGSFLRIQSVVVTNTSIKYSRRLGIDGCPIGAEAKISFQTYEIMTKNTLDSEIYKLPVAQILPAEKEEKELGKYPKYPELSHIKAPSMSELRGFGGRGF